jgi:hypothetical protein
VQVTSYKEVAEHVGLLSGSSSEEEKDKEEEVEDITDFDQGFPLFLKQKLLSHSCTCGSRSASFWYGKTGSASATNKNSDPHQSDSWIRIRIRINLQMTSEYI